MLNEKPSSDNIRLKMSNLSANESLRRARTSLPRNDQRKNYNNQSQDYKKYL